MRQAALPDRGRSFVPTWGRAFRGAAAIVLFGILWVILGIFLFLVGIAMIGFSMLANPLGSSAGVGLFQASGIVGFGLGLVLVIAGIALSLLGFLASFLKVMSEMTAEEIARRAVQVPRVLFQPATVPVTYHRIEPPPPPQY